MPPIIRSTRQAIYAAQATSSTNGVLQYRREDNSMRWWAWPCHQQQRVRPSSLRDHRQTTIMLGPCCLCPMQDDNVPDYVEAAIYRATDGPFSGQYVIGCAQDKCGYLVFAEKVYDRPGTYIKIYEARQPHEQIPPLPMHVSELNSMIGRPLKRTYAMLDINDFIPQVPAPVRRTPTPVKAVRIEGRKNFSNLLELLDSRVRPGVTETEFRQLFVKCECGYILTKRAFNDHACSREVIDLTDDVIDLTAA